MALNLFGFQISRQKTDVEQQSAKTFAPPSNEDGALTISAAAYYGTYVDLITTNKKPELDFLNIGERAEEDAFIVPFDDKRSIRRIVLTAEILD